MREGSIDFIATTIQKGTCSQKKYILLAESRSDLYKDVRSQRKVEKGNSNEEKK